VETDGNIIAAIFSQIWPWFQLWGCESGQIWLWLVHSEYWSLVHA